MVEPHHIDIAIIGEDFLNLLAIPFIVFGVVPYEIVRIIPITGRVVESDLHALSVTGIHELFHNIASVGGFHDVVIRLLRIEHRKAIVVLGDEHHVFHARFLRELHPSIRIKFFGIEALVVIVIHGIFEAGSVLVDIPWTVAIASPADFFLPKRDGPPVDKHSELRIAEPLQSRRILLAGLVELGNMLQRRRGSGRVFRRAGLCRIVRSESRGGNSSRQEKEPHNISIHNMLGVF